MSLSVSLSLRLLRLVGRVGGQVATRSAGLGSARLGPLQSDSLGREVFVWVVVGAVQDQGPLLEHSSVFVFAIIAGRGGQN